MIDYEKLQKSLKHLELQFANYQMAQNRPELTDIDREAIAESVIQRFETCYDTLWNPLKRHLIEETGLAEIPNSPKPVFKLAGQNKALPSPVENGSLTPTPSPTPRMITAAKKRRKHGSSSKTSLLMPSAFTKQ
jgi:hypothetical protein